MSDSRDLTVAEVARALNVGLSTVQRWCDTGEIASYRYPSGHRRVPSAEVARFKHEHLTPTRTPIGVTA